MPLYQNPDASPIQTDLSRAATYPMQTNTIVSGSPANTSTCQASASCDNLIENLLAWLSADCHWENITNILTSDSSSPVMSSTVCVAFYADDVFAKEMM